MANWWDKNLTDKQKFRLQEPKDPSLLDVVSTVPNPVGDVASGLLAAQDVSKGNYGTAALNALGLLPFVPSMGAMLKDVGKSAKTEFELAQDLAQQRAALPMSEGGLGLPATNTAMDRAKAMGFDINNPVYHGTLGDIKAFDRKKIKERFPQSFGIHTTSSPNEASIYADNYKNYLAEWNPNSKLAIPVEENANVIPLLTRNDNQLKIQTDYPTASMEADLNTSQIIDKLWEKKKIGRPYESVKIDRINEKPENSSWDGSNFIAMNPAVLRSRFAAFDPFRRNQNDILAGVAPLAVGSLLGLNTYNNMQEKPKKEKKKTK